MKNFKTLILLLSVITFAFSHAGHNHDHDHDHDHQHDHPTNEEELMDTLKNLENANYTGLGEDDGSQEEQIKEIMAEMGLTDKDTINREQFKVLFTRILLQDEEVQDEERGIFDKLIEKVINNAPEVFPTADLNKYVDMAYITSVLNEIMAEAGIDPKQAMEELKDFAGGAQGMSDDKEEQKDLEEHTDEEAKNDL